MDLEVSFRALTVEAEAEEERKVAGEEALGAVKRAMQIVAESKLETALRAVKTFGVEADPVAVSGSELYAKLSDAKEALTDGVGNAADDSGKLQTAITVAEALGFGSKAPVGSEERTLLDKTKRALEVARGRSSHWPHDGNYTSYYIFLLHSSSAWIRGGGCWCVVLSGHVREETPNGGLTLMSMNACPFWTFDLT